MTTEILLLIFGSVLSALGTLLLAYFKGIKTDISTMSASMVQMNLKLEKVITDQSWHKEEITELKERITSLESK
jgi:predicted  nucleic acid-binding Zn-ribbon protein